MQIVELGDCSMVIMKDSEDPPWISVGNIYRESLGKYRYISVYKAIDDDSEVSQASSDAIYTGGRLVLFFSNPVNQNFHLHDRVELSVFATRRSKRH